jgi:hypothetical protein
MPTKLSAFRKYQAGTADEVANAIATLRPIALDAAGLILAQEIERGLRRLAAAGPRRKRS